MELLLFIGFIWGFAVLIGKLAQKAQQERKAREAAARQAEAARIYRENKEYQERAARQRAAEKARAAAAEKQRKKEFAEAQARTTIEHYTPIRKQLETELNQLHRNAAGKTAEQIEKRIETVTEKIYQIDRKLEKAEFILYA